MDSLLKISDSKLFKEISEENRMQIKEDIVDFLYRFKDRYPSSNSKEVSMDIFFKIMDFLSTNELEPSKSLKEEYRNSDINKMLNELPPFEFLNQKIGITKEDYDKLEKRYSSKPSFIYYFNPDIKVKVKAGTNSEGIKWMASGFYRKGEVYYKQR